VHFSPHVSKTETSQPDAPSRSEDAHRNRLSMKQVVVAISTGMNTRLDKKLKISSLSSIIIIAAILLDLRLSWWCL
jgi:hypothetical protein